ncbi:MAG: hypothetical protein KGL35_04545 [Bradyrhizobium sp.]|nr:hypothetical protein [Bradyrhizobium sp.]
MTIKRTFIAGWTEAHKWGSMRLKALAVGLTALQQAWPNIPGGWKSSLPPSVPHILAYGAIASIVGAAYSQVTTKAKTP